jgi:hypothetical protein
MYNLVHEDAYNIGLIKEYFSSTFVKSLLLLLLLFIICSSSSLIHRTFATSPSFGLQEITDSRNNWVQTYGNDSTHLKSDYTNILAVDYLSDGKVLNATYWLRSNQENASTYNQPFKKVSYGMLINIDTNTITGYNGVDYDFYIEVVNGKWSQYLYQYSSTGNYALVESKANYTQSFGGSSTIGPGYVKLQLPLRSINYPSRCSVLFYAAESYKSNEVRDFTTWVDIPPSILSLLTIPNDITIRQGEGQLVPAEIKSGSGFSNDVTNITFSKGHNDIASATNPNGLHISIQRIHPPLFDVQVPPQTPVGVYTINFLTSISEPSNAEAIKPIFNDKISGFIDPEFQASKKYPVLGYVTSPTNITITVIPPLNVNDRFKDFWSIYGQPISIIAGGFAGGFASLIFGRVTKRT